MPPRAAANGPAVSIIKPFDGKAATVGNGVMVALAASSNQHEAEIAMRRAHELMLRHNIEHVAYDSGYELRHLGDRHEQPGQHDDRKRHRPWQQGWRLDVDVLPVDGDRATPPGLLQHVQPLGAGGLHRVFQRPLRGQHLH